MSKDFYRDRSLGDLHHKFYYELRVVRWQRPLPGERENLRGL